MMSCGNLLDVYCIVDLYYSLETDFEAHTDIKGLFKHLTLQYLFSMKWRCVVLCILASWPGNLEIMMCHPVSYMNARCIFFFLSIIKQILNLFVQWITNLCSSPNSKSQKSSSQSKLTMLIQDFRKKHCSNWHVLKLYISRAL